MLKPFRRRGSRIRPLLEISGTWWKSSSTYPELLRIPMRDGRVIRYVMDAQPIAIHVGKDGWRKTGYEIVGYQYKEPAIKKSRIHRKHQL